MNTPSPRTNSTEATLFVDTSALLRRYVHAPGRDLVMATMESASNWSASALARTEVLLALRQMAVHAGQQDELWQMARDEWETFWVVPVDDRCLARAVEIGTEYGLRTIDAIHLAAAQRVPAPVRFLTFDRRQIPAAAALGFDVVSPVAA
ncbi:MAG: uncharacterized protein QOJ19_4873 [Acidimicrobiia bacterium]|jgi:predicted nucleic acid-binding protein|nr:uncharacterized protein [Acidimicrobiia bacterium]